MFKCFNLREQWLLEAPSQAALTACHPLTSPSKSARLSTKQRSCLVILKTAPLLPGEHWRWTQLCSLLKHLFHILGNEANERNTASQELVWVSFHMWYILWFCPESPEHSDSQGTNTELMGSILHQTATPELTGTPRQWGCACIHLWARDIHGKRFPTAAQQVFGIETQGFAQATSKSSKSLIFP